MNNSNTKRLKILNNLQFHPFLFNLHSAISMHIFVDERAYATGIFSGMLVVAAGMTCVGSHPKAFWCRLSFVEFVDHRRRNERVVVAMNKQHRSLAFCHLPYWRCLTE